MKKAIVTALALILLIPVIWQVSIFEVIKLRTFDALVETKQETGNFVVLNITEEDIEREGGYPLPRERLAEIHADLFRAGATGIGWGISFPQPDRLGGDEVFAEMLGLGDSVVAMFETDTWDTIPKTEGTVIIGDEAGGIEASGVKENIPIIRQNTLQGIVSAPVDIDNLVRRMPLLMRSPDGWMASFGTQLLKTATGTETYVIKTNELGIEEVRVKLLEPIPTDKFGRVWVNWIVPRGTTLQEMNVADKIVIIGTTAKGIMPQVATPVGLLYPHQIQAALAETMIHASYQTMPSIPNNSQLYELLIFAIGVFMVFIMLNYLGVYAGIALASVTIVGTGGLGLYFISKGLLIDVTYAMISEFVMAAATFYLNYKEQYKLRQQIKKQFEHYLDPRQVKKLQDNPDLLTLGGESRYCTYLFTDVRGFTALSESVTPEEVTYIMNEALTAQQAAVSKCHGMVDKYIGDAMMAVFGAPLDLPNHEEWAIQCAKEIQKNMEELNYVLVSKGIDPVQIGIGINSGAAIVGNMGSRTRFDYTCIGDAVNVAARLESGTKAAGVDVLIGEATAQKSNSRLQLLEPIAAKGKAEKLQVYTIWD